MGKSDSVGRKPLIGIAAVLALGTSLGIDTAQADSMGSQGYSSDQVKLKQEANQHKTNVTQQKWESNTIKWDAQQHKQPSNQIKLNGGEANQLKLNGSIRVK